MRKSNDTVARSPKSANAVRTWKGKELEQLEQRQLMAATLPLSLDFSQAVAGSIVDSKGLGTGFSGKEGYSYYTALDTRAGTLALSADYSHSAATTALATTFDGTTRGFTVTARLIGPLSSIRQTSDQAGVFFGNDQYNSVRLVAIKTAAGESLQFQTLIAGKIVGTDAASYVAPGVAFSTITTLDLQLTGDSVTGTVTARYSINGKSWQKINFGQTIPTANVLLFFNANSKAGLIVSDRHTAITTIFDSFSIAPGLTAAVPVTGISRNSAVFSDIVTTNAASSPQTVRLSNTGSVPLIVSGATFTGDNASEFTLTTPISSPIIINPGERYDFYVTFKTSSTKVVRTATLSFTTNDTNLTSTVALRGLGLGGAGGIYEPSLQRIINLYGIPISTGQAESNDNSFPVDTATANSVDEVAMQQLVAASSDPVTIELLGVFANQVSATSIGWYEAGNPQTTYKLAGVAASLAQSLSPNDDGVISFSPGTNSFGLYGNFTLGSTAKPINRNVYSETSLNTWETNASRQKKVRFYQMRDSSGAVLPNAYVFAFEEYNVTFDQNDIVGIVRNVKPAAVGPEIGLENLDGFPAADQLVFSRVQTKDKDLLTQADHDVVSLRIRNTGAQPLNISDMVLSNTDFQIVSGGGAQTVAAGDSIIVKVKFVYSNASDWGNKIRTATLAIKSDDADEATKTVKLSGIWQSYSENQPNGISAEPTAEQVIEAMGYGTRISTASSPINTHGVNTAAGDEVLSQLWQRADSGLPVNVTMLATYHQVYNVDWNTHSTVYTYDPSVMDSATGKPKVNFLLTHNQINSQSVLPLADNSTTSLATASWIPTSSVFGFNVDGQKNGTYSQDQYNTPNDANNAGHGWRFYVAKDAKGNIIPDTYLACQDYVKVSWANYDYQDNILLITNIRPTQSPQNVLSVTASATGGAATISWKTNTANDVTGYNVYRGLSTDGAFTKISASPVAATAFSDTAITAGTTYFYYVTAAAYQGGESDRSAIVSVTGTSVTKPNAATSVAATATSATSVSLSWADNSTNETGFRIERKIGIGNYVALATVPANVSTFVDAAASATTTYTYRVVAVNAAGDAAASNEATLTTPAAGTTTTPATASLISADVGNPTPVGNVTTVTANKDYNVAVGGVDIWGTYDSFNFIYGQKTGDFDVVVHVTGLTNLDPSTQAGLMVRESLASGAKNVNVKIRPSGYRLTYRSDTNGQTAAAGSGSGSLTNAYLRLQRAGGVFNSYVSSDGVTWTLLASVSMSMNSTVYVGLATCGKSTTAAATANYRGYGNTSDLPAAATTTPVVGTPTTPTTPPVSSPATSQVLTAVADTYVYDGSKTSNYGSAPSLQVKAGVAGYNRQTLLTFDISTLTSPASAKLRLQANLNTADSVQIAAYGVMGAWSESAASWATKPAAVASALGTAMVTSTSAGWIEIDLTNYVQQAVAAGQSTVSLSLQGTTSSTAFVAIASRENGANAPQLVVN